MADIALANGRFWRELPLGSLPLGLTLRQSMTSQEFNRQHLSARRFNRPPPLFRWAYARGLLNDPGRALVFGAGLLVEANELLRLGWTVDALETARSVEARPRVYGEFAKKHRARVLTELVESRRTYRIITVTHVLEFESDRQKREELLKSLVGRLTDSGVLLLSLRGWSDVGAAKRQVRHGDGFITGLGTWTRGYTVDEAKQMLGRAGLRIWDSPHTSRAATPRQVWLACMRGS